MSRPSPLAGRLTATQRRVLEGRLRRPTAQQREVVRARIVLAAADGEQNTQTVPSEPRCSPRPAAAGWPNFTPDGQRDLR